MLRRRPEPWVLVNGPEERLAELVRRHRLPLVARERLGALLVALAAEPDPPTTVRDPRPAVDLHVADSLSGLALESVSRASRVADIGAGAGFPGLALAVALPDAHVDLIEASRRKCDVIERLALAAGLMSCRALAVRAEDWAAGEGRDAYDAVTARALAPLGVLVEYAAPLLRHGGALVAWKGRRDAAEEAGGDAAAQALGLAPRGVRRVLPFEGARERHLHTYAKTGPTPPGYPRRAGMARKRPVG